MNGPKIRLAGDPSPKLDPLADLLAATPPPIAVLVNADAVPDSALIIARCRAFADALPAGDASLIEFTRQAALAWAPRRLRLNAIALGTPLRAAPATPADLDRTIRAIAAWPSMTGQIIRLGA